MYYKVKMNNDIIDALDELQCVFYSAPSDSVLRCGKRDEPEGIISSDGTNIWAVHGWPALKGDYKEVELIDIDEEEFKALRKLLAEGIVQEPPEEQEQDPGMDILEWTKKQKILLSKAKLAEFLEKNPLVSDVHNGVPGIYSATAEKQQLMALNFSTWQLKQAAGIPCDLTWNESGKTCEIWNPEEYMTLIIQMEAYVKPYIAKQQHYEQDILLAKTVKEVADIEINY